MFVTNNKNNTKKKFQKPNILRRKAKVPVQRPQLTVESYESPEIHSLVTTAYVDESLNGNELQNRLTKQVVIKQRLEKPNQVGNKPTQKLLQTAYFSEENGLHVAKGITKKGNGNDITFAVISPQSNNNSDSYVQNSVNVESFLVGTAVNQSGITLEGTELHLETLDKYDNAKWCLDLTQDSHKVIKDHYTGSQTSNMFLEQKLDVVTTMVPLSVVSTIQKKNVITIQGEMVPSINSIQSNTLDDFSINDGKFKCEAENCNKEFSNKQKLKKHQNIHNKEGSARPARQTTVECPIKAVHSGVEEPCGRTFTQREELLKHLNEEHTLEQANYICGECGRRFFWASGLRAHGRAHGQARVGGLACAWPGCGRVFRQPCRLREHTRAHTGDKPYPCKYPNCGWSFRTASKLVRHARRHTGERRHACPACPRAFLRREHLRDHHARHHAHHACTHQGCQQSFNNISSLNVHLKKVHKKEGTNTEKAEIPNAALVAPNADNTYTVSLLHDTSAEYGTVAKIELCEGVRMEDAVGIEMEVQAEADVEAEAEAGVEADADVEAIALTEADLESEQHAARTHCTWPLPRIESGYGQCTDGYVIEDMQVEQSEGSENNIYTIRSDLFLHGNVLTNEDSESMVGGATSVVGGTTGTLSDDLGLLDAHPTIDLMQEELMYTDAVDESSFRVFLLSGEELT